MLKKHFLLYSTRVISINMIFNSHTGILINLVVFFFFSKITVNVEMVDDDTNEISFKKVVTSYYHGQMSGNQVIGLEPNTDFWVTVEMFNSAGLSNPSERQRLSTCLGGRNYSMLL